MSPNDEIPAGYVPYAEPSTFIDRVGPLYQRNGTTGFAFGLRVVEHNCNRRGFAHGGLITSLADVALGKSCEWSQQPPLSLITVCLTVEFLSSARLGDWVEATNIFSQIGKRIAFAECSIASAGRNVARARGIYAVRDGS